jgi:hypothetical protein
MKVGGTHPAQIFVWVMVVAGLARCENDDSCLHRPCYFSFERTQYWP